jgi:hypothetical protein
MTPAAAWASLLLRTARRDGLWNVWLWIGPLLVAQQISDLERRPWVLYLIPLFGSILGSALNGRGVAPGGAQMGASPALLIPVAARARVIGALVAGAVVSGVVCLTAFLAVLSFRGLIDLVLRGHITNTPDLARGLQNAATCVLALLPTVALSAAAPPGRSVPWQDWMLFVLIAAGVYFHIPAILGDFSTLALLSVVLCTAVVGVAPFLERMALRGLGRPAWDAVQAVRAERPIGFLGGPARTPARALLRIHASIGLAVTSGMTAVLCGLGAVVFFLSGDPDMLPFLLPMVATLGAALLPTLPLATGPAGAFGFDVRPAMWLPVRPSTVWWTSLAAAGAQLGIALAVAMIGTAALALAVPSVSITDAATRILPGFPLCAAAVLLLRAALYLGPLMPAWARTTCFCGGAFAGLAAPVEIGLTRSLFGGQRFVFSVAFLLAAAVLLVALTPRRAP